MLNPLFKNYPEILGSKGLKLEDCEIHQFVFRNRNQNTFHYRIMEEGIRVILYDTHNDDDINPFTGSLRDPMYGTVFVTLPKGDGKIFEIKGMAAELGGQYNGVCNPNDVKTGPQSSNWVPARTTSLKKN